MTKLKKGFSLVKAKLLAKRETDMFQKTQSRMTLFNSGMLMIFLVLFNVIVLGSLYTIMTNDQERRITTLVDQEMVAIKEFLIEQSNHPGRSKQNVVFLSEDQFFYYVVSPNGELILGNEVDPRLRTVFIESIERWLPHAEEQRYADVEISREMNHRKKAEPKNLKLLMSAKPIVIGDQFVGYLYVGTDVTSFYRLFHWLTALLIGLSVLFVGLAIVFSRIMSKRALIPIHLAYNRQREFVANASHELRTPLSVIYSSVEALELEDEIVENEFSKKMLYRLKDESKRMTKLINDLLTLARSDSEHASLELAKESFDFFPHVERTMQSFEKLAWKKKIEMKLDSPTSLPIRGDADKLTQLLYILLDNAIKYTPNEGSVQLSLRLVPLKSQQELTISVKDSGIGMNEEDAARIFDRFYRVNKARTRQQGGHGLGLSIAKWIVDAHKGSVVVKSEEGNGTEFIVKIPS